MKKRRTMLRTATLALLSSARTLLICGNGPTGDGSGIVHVAVPITLLAMGLAGIGVGIGLTVASNDAATDMQTLDDAIPGDEACSSAASPFVTQCGDLADARDDRDAFSAGAIAAYVLGGAAALTAAGLFIGNAATPSSKRGVELRTNGLSLSIHGTW
jgi:hypothetical protein